MTTTSARGGAFEIEEEQRENEVRAKNPGPRTRGQEVREQEAVVKIPG
eukprot:CAMPEP_0172591220 /NCGR_PEP_ID=MMETSP1068-20121228/9899_1 /TAXON_ID=35684 /ORGANISM="Pseudopedinella elastica, Strain CCMP716" /LENGTH=47 /DNA_ID= /DNA_START= /DNA_END= /DNA_ORIENTATION=